MYIYPRIALNGQPISAPAAVAITATCNKKKALLIKQYCNTILITVHGFTSVGYTCTCTHNWPAVIHVVDTTFYWITHSPPNNSKDFVLFIQWTGICQLDCNIQPLNNSGLSVPSWNLIVQANEVLVKSDCLLIF